MTSAEVRIPFLAIINDIDLAHSTWISSQNVNAHRAKTVELKTGFTTAFTTTRLSRLNSIQL